MAAQFSDSDSRQTFSVNEDLALSFVTLQNIRAIINDDQLTDDQKKQRVNSNTFEWRENSDSYRTFDMQILGTMIGHRDGPFAWHINKNEMGYQEESEFWSLISERFAAKARGMISVAVDSTTAFTQFCRREYAAIMKNPDITDVRIIKGQPMPDSKAFIRIKDGVVINVDRGQKAPPEDSAEYFFYNMIPDEKLEILPKAEWAERQKQQWFDTTMAKLDHYFTGKKVEQVSISDTVGLGDIAGKSGG